MYIMDKQRLMYWTENLAFILANERYMAICECGEIFYAPIESKAHYRWAAHNRGANFHIVRAMDDNGVTQIQEEAK